MIDSSPATKLHIPLEVSTACLRFVSPLEAWANRQVCRGWRDYVENVLAQSIWLPTMKVTIDGGLMRDKDYNKHLVASEFVFDTLLYDEPEDVAAGADGAEVEHTDDDPCRIAQFVDFRALDLYDDVRRELTRQGCMPRARRSHVWLPVAGIVNDVTIPDLKIDWKAFTLEMDWRAVIVALMKEEMAAAKLKVACKARMMEATLALKVQMQQAGVDAMQVFDVALDHWGKYKEEVDEVYETLRQQRLGDEPARGAEALKRERAVAEGMTWPTAACRRDDSDSDESEDEDEDDEMADFEGHDLTPVAED